MITRQERVSRQHSRHESRARSMRKYPGNIKGVAGVASSGADMESKENFVR